MVPSIRRQVCNEAPPRPEGDYVLYWLLTNRRATWNFSLQRAIEWAQELDKPLVVLESLGVSQPWACDRFHRFVLEGMRENRHAFAARGALYYPYVEPAAGAGDGLLQALAAHACVVVTDEFPCFFLPQLVRALSPTLGVRVEMVDSNGLLPLRATDKAHATAYSFRRMLHKTLPAHLLQLPQPDPLANTPLPRLEALPERITRRWPAATKALLDGEASALAALPIDHAVRPVDTLSGGHSSACEVLDAFLSEKLARYDEARNVPDEAASSGLSIHLHWGHISAHEVFARLMRQEGWTPANLSSKPTGQRHGWWGASPEAESFLDELITWRELSFNTCVYVPNYDRYESLPEWAQATLDKHAADPRPVRYALSEFEAARTHDPLWNAAQRQLVREGRIHNYLRMLWGKKILEWSASPREALDTLIQLNNKYALDGRDPNSYGGISWILGRYDRPWGPERPIFGTIRYMSSENTARKVSVKEYLRRYAGP
ncbi:deoxyribodipyrimidine photolyase [bacterium]|nr:deoxyribodipyrimidine photolyase [bacterium]